MITRTVICLVIHEHGYMDATRPSHFPCEGLACETKKLGHYAMLYYTSHSAHRGCAKKRAVVDAIISSSAHHYQKLLGVQPHQSTL